MMGVCQIVDLPIKHLDFSVYFYLKREWCYIDQCKH